MINSITKKELFEKAIKYAQTGASRELTLEEKEQISGMLDEMVEVHVKIQELPEDIQRVEYMLRAVINPSAWGHYKIV